MCSISYSTPRYEDIKVKLTPFLKKVGFNPKTGKYYENCCH